MRISGASFAVLLGLSFSAGALSAQSLSVPVTGAETVTINDKVNKNQFVWVSEAPLENIKGSSEGVTGSFTIDPQNLTKMRGTISTQVKTMKTGNATRDNHLVSAEWLDAAKFPVITFTVLSIENVKTTGTTATAYAVGNFTMHGVTKKITVPIGLSYVQESDKTRQRAPGDFVFINASFNISLKDFNIAGQEGTVGSKVGETIKITAQLFGNVTGKSTS